MSKTKSIKKQLLTGIPIILLGILILIFLVSNKLEVKRTDFKEKEINVRIIKTQKGHFIPKILAHGIVKPSVSLNVIPEVNGKISWLNPELKTGAILKKGSDLLKIETIDYELILSRIRTQLATSKLELEELNANKENLLASIKIEEESEKLGENELNRQIELVRKKASAVANLDREKRNLLMQKQKVQNLKNQLNIIPHKLNLIKSKIKLFETQVKEAERNIEKCTIKLPFNGRIGTISLQEGQFIPAGRVLFKIEGTDMAEIVANLQPVQFKNLIHENGLKKTDKDFSPDILKEMGLKVKIRYKLNDSFIEWDGNISGTTEGLDPRTRTIGIIVEVKDPYKSAVPGIRPPLLKDMFVEVLFNGNLISDHYIIPREAIKNNRLFVKNKENRLEKRDIKIDYLQENIAVIKDGISENDEIIVSDIIFPVDGILLNAVEDKELMTKCLNEAKRSF